MRLATRREPLVDALRAWALLGVLVVNAQSTLTGPWGSPLGLPTPADSAAAWGAFGVVAWLFQGKSYPLLAFLFGYGQALGRRGGHARRQTRLRRLIMLGVLHGSLLFAGDILTFYGVFGLALLALGRLRARALWRLLWCWVALAVGMQLLALFVLGRGAAPPFGPTYASVQGPTEFLAVNASAYGSALIGGVVVFGPELMALMTAGLLAGRLGLLRRARWRPLLTRTARWALPLGLLANAVYAVAATHVSTGVAHPPLWVGLIGPLGWLLAAGYAAALAQAWHTHRGRRMLAALAPLGRRTLSAYVGLSLLLALALSGAGLRLPLGSAALLLCALAFWGVALAASRVAELRGWRGPLETWVARP